MKHAFTEEQEHTLQAQASLLFHARPFTRVDDESIALLEKQDIFLTLAGIRRVAEVDGNYDWWDEQGQLHILPYEEAEVRGLLSELGLKCHLSYDENNVHAIISKSQEVVDEYTAGRLTQERYGELLGYPASAVYAFATNTCMSMAEQDAIELPLGITTSFFRFSNTNWQEELAVEIEWRAILAHFGLPRQR